MASNQQQQQTTPPASFPGWAIALIVVMAIALIVSMFFLFGKSSNMNVGAPVPTAVAPPAMSSMSNVSSGNMGAGLNRSVANIR
jgi:hypothetical protein